MVWWYQTVETVADPEAAKYLEVVQELAESAYKDIIEMKVALEIKLVEYKLPRKYLLFYSSDLGREIRYKKGSIENVLSKIVKQTNKPKHLIHEFDS